MHAYISVIDKINNIIKYVAYSTFLLLAVLVFAQVVTRFVISYPLAWTEEISRYLTVYIVFLGSALAMRQRLHIAIDFLPEIVSAVNKKRLNMVILVICAVFFTALTYFGTVLTVTVAEQSTPTLQFSMAWAYAAIPLGSFMMLLNTIANILEWKTGEVTKSSGDIV